MGYHQLRCQFRLFGEENFGEWPTNKIQILNSP